MRNFINIIYMELRKTKLNIYFKKLFLKNNVPILVGTVC